MQFMDQHILLALIALPMIGAAVIMAIPSTRAEAVRRVATAFGLVVMLLSFYLFARYYFDGDGARFANSWQWLSLPGPWKFGDIGISLALGVDGVAAPMLLLTGIVMFTGVLVSWSIRSWNKDFFILYFLLLAGVFGVFASYDLFFFFFFYELSVLPMYLLIGVWGSSSRFPKFSRTKEYSAMKLTLYLVAGSVLIWVALMAIFVEAGLGTFDIKRLAVVEYSPTFQKVFFPFLAVGFGILAGLVAVSHMVAGRACGSAHSRQHGACGRADEAGSVRHHPRGYGDTAGGGGVLDARAGRAWHGECHLRRNLCDGTNRSEVCHRLLQREPHGICGDGHRHAAPAGAERCGAADVLARYNDGAVLRGRGRGL